MSGGGTYDASLTLARTTLHPTGTEHLDPLTGWLDHRMRPPEDLAPTMAPIEDPSFDASGTVPQPGHGLFDLAGTLNLSFEPDIACVWLASLLRKAAAVTTVEAGAYRWVLGPSQTAQDFSSRRLAHRVYRDDATGAYTAINGQALQATLDLATSANAALSLGYAFGRGHYWADPSQTNGSSGQLGIRGYSRLDLAETTESLTVTVDAVAGSAADVTLAMTGATPLSQATTGVPIGAWFRAMLSDGGVGARPHWVEIYLPSDVALNDAWTIPQTRSSWTPAYPPIQSMSTVEWEVYIDGVLAQERGAKASTVQVQIGPRPSAGSVQGIGGVWSDNTRSLGRLPVTVNVGRDWLSQYVTLRGERFEPFDIALVGYSPVLIDGTSTYYEARFDMPHCIDTGKRTTMTADGVQTEQIQATAHRANTAGAGGTTDAVTVTLTNSLATLPNA